MADLTPETRAGMRRKANLGVGAMPQQVFALLDYCDRLERERDEGKSKFDHFWDQAYEQKARAQTAESALAAAHERMREMKEALEHIEQNDAFWANNGPLPRVLANYRKGNANA